jgi:hypothetical protein
MPKTRNINHTQWSAANSGVTAPKSDASRKHRNGTGISQDEEKENIGKQTTETRTHRRRGNSSTVLGSSTVGKTSTKGKVASKGKKTTAREKKMPLQDITSQFFPTAESANRGVDSGDQREASIYEDSTNRVLATVPSPEASPLRHVVASPLPPSSPPSEPTSSPVKFSYSTTDKLLESLGERPESQYIYEQWDNFDDPQTALPQEYSTPIQSNSDPFGFTAVERKLKQEREIAAVLAEPDQEDVQNIYEDLDDIPVADTSSPRPVRRIKRRHGHSNQPSESEENYPAVVLPIVLSYPSYCTPPTPHKDKQKHRRLSHPGHGVFSPCSSSVESSPSPTKASSSKRRRTVRSEHDPLDEFNEEVEKSCISDVVLDKLPLPKRQRKVSILADQEQGHQDAVAKNLRPRTRAAVSHTDDETHAEPPKRKKPLTSKNQKTLHSKSQSSKKTATENNENGKIDEVSCRKDRNVSPDDLDCLEMAARARRTYRIFQTLIRIQSRGGKCLCYLNSF